MLKVLKVSYGQKNLSSLVGVVVLYFGAPGSLREDVSSPRNSPRGRPCFAIRRAGRREGLVKLNRELHVK